MNGLYTVAQQIGTYISGPFGIATITAGVGGAWLGAAAHLWPASYGTKSLIYGAGAFTAGYFASWL